MVMSLSISSVWEAPDIHGWCSRQGRSLFIQGHLAMLNHSMMKKCERDQAVGSDSLA